MFRATKSMSSILPLKMQMRSFVPVSSRLKTRCRLWPALAEVQSKDAWGPSKTGCVPCMLLA